MATDLPTPNGLSRRIRPPVPVIVMLISIVVAVGAVSVLIFALFKSTTGPGESLRKYYQAVVGDDCGTAYGFLSDTLRDRYPQDAFCRSVLDAHQRRQVPANVTIKQVTGFGEPPAQFAAVVIQELGPAANRTPVHWRMVREGDSWRIATFDNTRCAMRAGPHTCVPPLG